MNSLVLYGGAVADFTGSGRASAECGELNSASARAL